VLPLVLLPAMLCDAELYAAQVAALGDAAEIAIGPVADRPLPDAAGAFLAGAPSRFALAGTSAGGNLALEILTQAPARVAGLWLMGSNPGAHGDPDGARAQSARVRAGEFDAVVEDLAARAVHAGGPRGGAAADTFRRMARRAGPGAFVRQNDAMIARAARWPALDALGVPTLLLWGRHDQFSGVDRALAIAARVPSASLVVLDDCGHLPTLEHPAATTRAARAWLKSLRA
jgi:pimeloyl-ACP methyl ester carboxylesterase